MKKILCLYYSQTGMQRSILESLMRPFIQEGDKVHFERILPQEDFPFPWSGFTFFNAFPETFKQVPLPLKKPSPEAYADYDLILLGYQPWFLTPSRPISSFLQSEEAIRIFSGKKVVTILGCRNMWLGAQEKVKKALLALKADLIGHIALVDRSGNTVSLVTILRWMLKGKKDPFWFFPAAGVSDKDVHGAFTFGEIIRIHLNSGQLGSLQDALNEKGAIEINPSLVLMERRGQKAFSIWASFIGRGGEVTSLGRKIRVYIFMFLLPTAVLILSPLLWTLSKILLVVKRKELGAEIQYFKQNSLRNLTP